MKKHLLVALCCSALLFSACGGGGDDNSSSAGNTSSSSSTAQKTSGTSSHTHSFQFQSFEWTLTPGAYTAKAIYKCLADGETNKFDAAMSKTTDAPTHVANGVNHWKASYDGHQDTKDEVLLSPGHAYNAVGLCLADGAYKGTTLSVGVESSLMTFEAGETYYFRLPAVANHTYRIPSGSGRITPSEALPYYLDANGTPQAMASKDVPFPATTYDGYIYYVHTPGGQEPNVKLLVNFNKHNPTDNDFGVCFEHNAYDGYEFDTNDLIDFGDMADGDVEYRRFAANSVHQYGLNLPAPLTDEDISCAILKEGNFTEVNLQSLAYNQITGFDDLSEDGYVYVRIQAHGAKPDASFGVDEEHFYNMLGVCLYDHAWGGNDADSLIPGEESENVAHTGGETYNYRVEAYAGHIYHFVPTSWQTSNTDYYYLTASGVPTLFDIEHDAFPGATWDNYIYVVYTPASDVTGHFRITVTEHPVEDEHGDCLHGYLGDTLTFNVAADNYNLPAGEYKYYRIVFSTIELVPPYDLFSVNYGGYWYDKVEVWYKATGTWTQFFPEDQGGGPDEEEYDGTGITPDDGYLYFQIHNTTGGTMAINGFMVC